MHWCVQVGEHRGGRVPDSGQQHGGRPLGHGQGQHQDELREAQPGDKVSSNHSVCLSIDLDPIVCLIFLHCEFIL